MMRFTSHLVKSLMAAALLLGLGTASARAAEYTASVGSATKVSRAGEAVLPLTIAWTGTNDPAFATQVIVSQDGLVGGVGSTSFDYPDLWQMISPLSYLAYVHPENSQDKFHTGLATVNVIVWSISDASNVLDTSTWTEKVNITTTVRLRGGGK
jgi:hypothetical protein